jgi:dTDP-4-amino-4,6-dideoxygalactose transaminase
MTDDPAGWAVPLADLRVDAELLDAAGGALASGWWSLGPRVAAFEEEFAQRSGARHAIAVANGTAALHLALVAVGCGPGDEVVVPSLNFVAAANAIIHAGARPVFWDVHGVDDLNADPDDLAAAMTPATRAIVALHYAGHPCNLEAIQAVARERGVAIVEDAAHAPGATYRGRWCGTIGDVGCYSFFSNKNMPVGEGGLVVTDDDAYAERIRLLRSHGMTSLTWDRHRGHAPSYDVLDHGFNYRLDEVRAAIGRVQLARLEAENAARAAIVAEYRRAFTEVDGLTMPFAVADPATLPAHHLAVVVLPHGHSRDRFRAHLSERRIQTSVHYPPIHRFTAFAACGQSRSLAVTDGIADRLVTLPLFGHMTGDQVSDVVHAVQEGLETRQAGTAPE